MISYGGYMKKIYLSMLVAVLSVSVYAMEDPEVFTLGIENEQDNFLNELAHHKNDKLVVGVITNQTGKNHQGDRTVDILLARGFDVRYIFVPEHGMDGTINAEGEVGNAVDKSTGIAIISMYGHGTGRKMADDTLKDIDVLVFDIQDSGMRHYTYISTLLHVMEATAKHDIFIVVMDRPNPLGGNAQGPVCPKNTKSFIAVAPIPLRHGMTVGELARFFNTHVLVSKAKLHVVPMQNYAKSMGLPGDLLAPLSPFIPNKYACYGYSFLGLLGEVRPFDTGLGTDKPFEYVAVAAQHKVPTKHWTNLRTRLQALGVKTELCSYFSARKKQECKGLRFIFEDINTVPSFDVLLTVLKFFHDAKVPLTFSKYFDTAIGSKHVHDYVKGKMSKDVLMKDINARLAQFKEQTKHVYLYE